MMNLKDARTMLGVSHDCSLPELNKRYRILALKLHPDKNGDTPEATAAFQELNDAYRILLSNCSNEANDTNDEAKEPYVNIFMNFIKSLFKDKVNCKKDNHNQVLLDLLHRIVHDYASASVNSALDSLDPSVLFQLYETLEQYNSAVSMDHPRENAKE
jgi:hypothetical protein